MEEGMYWTTHYGRRTFQYSNIVVKVVEERSWVAMNIGTLVTNKERMHECIM